MEKYTLTQGYPELNESVQIFPNVRISNDVCHPCDDFRVFHLIVMDEYSKSVVELEIFTIKIDGYLSKDSRSSSISIAYRNSREMGCFKIPLCFSYW